MIYLDNAATTQVSESIKPIIDEFLYSKYGNAGSNHSLGRMSSNAILSAREKVSSFFGAIPENIIFTSSGSEANTMAIIGVSDYLIKHNKTHIITTRYEHKSVLESMKKMEECGFEVEYLNVIGGVVSERDLIDALRDDTGLVSIMYVNNETGSKNNIESMARLCSGKGILFHTDCVQAVGTEDLNIERLGVDMITISGHKIHAPKGIGCLCIRDRSILSNIICGGKQEFGLRPGTENTAFIVALGEIISRISLNDNKKYISKLRDVFIREIMRKSRNANIKVEINCAKVRCTPKVLSLRFENVDAESLIMLLNENNIYVSSGSACMQNSVEPSYALIAVGLSESQARSSIRVSFSEYTTINDVVVAANTIIDCATILLDMM